jgi:hypothetical protein
MEVATQALALLTTGISAVQKGTYQTVSLTAMIERSCLDGELRPTTPTATGKLAAAAVHHTLYRTGDGVNRSP